MNPQSLTSRQRKIRDYILDHTAVQGFPPSVREIALHFGVSPAAIQKQLNRLERKGALTRKKGSPRTVHTL